MIYLAIPIVEFVEIVDRLPRMHPGLLFALIFVALPILWWLTRYRSVIRR